MLMVYKNPSIQSKGSINHIHYVWEIFQKTLQLMTRKNWA